MWGGIIIGTVGFLLGCLGRGDLVFFQLSAPQCPHGGTRQSNPLI